MIESRTTATGLRIDGTIRSIAGRNGGTIEAPFMLKRGAYYLHGYDAAGWPYVH